ncbi:flagellar export chaperone FliS [Virgibacillus sp. MSJ-26]|uniref:flagellar export chaperone FliS n=1 Tax=Virgibacillus sp. MSJ-26 TaxID=2841522 RepID=UPI001C0F9451|nr:flagellar export chaperone FliS [Virgibacillus sp. MSJ-26]MBU5467790.1 flagellar export chaperone FliS [Virgibacillus sp. MSJ-26]
MSLKQYQAYQNNAVNTASGGELTLMLYNSCIKFIRQAIKDVEAKDFEKKNTHIQKAQRIIQELMLTLDQDIAISKEMLPLYDFMYFQLTEANVNNETKNLEDALSLAIDFRDTWKEVLLKTRKQSATQGAQV